MPLHRIRALATDYDRTLTDERLRVVPEALEAIATARKAGLQVVLISGRDLDFLEKEMGHLVDAIVAENGCIVLQPGGQPEHTSEPWDLHAALACLDIPLERGRVIASADIEHEPLLRETLERAGLLADLVRNRDRVMVLPRGIDKAAGLLVALKALAIPPGACAAAGDGENDVPLLEMVGYGIAVANAVPELKAHADHVTARFGGHGLAAWIVDLWLPAHGVKDA